MCQPSRAWQAESKTRLWKEEVREITNNKNLQASPKCNLNRNVKHTWRYYTL